MRVRNVGGMSGVKLQEHLIAHGNPTPMIFITAFPEDRIREQAMRAGAIGFLAKPFDETELLECVERALTRRREGQDDTCLARVPSRVWTIVRPWTCQSPDFASPFSRSTTQLQRTADYCPRYDQDHWICLNNEVPYLPIGRQSKRIYPSKA